MQNFLWDSWGHLIRTWLLMCGLAMVLLAGLSWVDRKTTDVQESYKSLQAKLTEIEAQAKEVYASSEKTSLSERLDFTAEAPVSVSTNKLLNQMTEMAAKGAVSITEFEIQEHAATTTELPRVEVLVRTRGTYPMTKAWIAQLQQRYAWLTVQRWSMQKAVLPNIESVLVLNVWKRPAGLTSENATQATEGISVQKASPRAQ